MGAAEHFFVESGRGRVEAHSSKAAILAARIARKHVLCFGHRAGESPVCGIHQVPADVKGGIVSAGGKSKYGIGEISAGIELHSIKTVEAQFLGGRSLRHARGVSWIH